MEIKKVIEFLEENNYKYTVLKEVITIHLELSQNVVIDLTNPSKTIISDYLSGWNFLTGMIKMSLKNAFLYNFVALLIFGFFCQFASFSDYNFNSFLLLFIGWVLLFSVFYLIKLEAFKLHIISARK